VVSVGLGNSFIETAILRRDGASLEANREAARQLAHDLSERGCPPSTATPVSGGWLLRGAPVEPVMNFIGSFKNHPGSMLTDPAPVRQYIQDRQNTELKRWDILFASVERRLSEDVLVDNSLGLTIRCQRRAPGAKSDNTTLRITNKQRVASRGVERTGLTPEQITSAEELYRSQEGISAEARSLNYPDRIYRTERETPLLIIHLLKVAPDPQRDAPISNAPLAAPPGESENPIVAYSVSFPRTATEEKKVVFVVNTTWLRENFHGEFDPDEMEGDDD
jgi:hypothetical protein